MQGYIYMKKIFCLMFAFFVGLGLNGMYDPAATTNAMHMWFLLKNNPASLLESFFEKNGGGTYINSIRHDGLAPLHYAVKQGAYRKVACLLRHGADIELPTSDGDRVLHIAMLNNYVGLVKLLLKNHAAPNAHSSTGLSPLHAIVTQDQSDNAIAIYKSLIKHKADKEEEINGGTPLYFAVSLKNYKFVELLLKDGANPNARVAVDMPTSILYCAADWGLLQAVKLLIAYGAYVNHPAGDNWTPLHIAVQNNRLDVVKFLLDNWAFVNMPTSDNDSALHIAAEHDLQDMALLLLERGSCPYLVDSSQKTALQIAQERGHHNIVSIIQTWQRDHVDDSETEDEEG